MICDLGQELVKGGPLVNFSEVVVHLPEYLVLCPSASWRFLKIWWVGVLRHNATEVEDCIQNVSLRPGRPRRQMPQMPRTQLIIFADVYNLLYRKLSSSRTTFKIHGLVKKRIILEKIIHQGPARSWVCDRQLIPLHHHFPCFCN